MNKKIYTKRVLLGLCAGILATLAIGAGFSSSQVGRYQLSGIGNHGLVVDTATGQVWSHFLSSSGGSAVPRFFEPKTETKK
jgi:hypothetical protein